MVALKQLGLALRDTGNYLDAAFVGWLLLTLLPTAMLNDPEFLGIADQVAGSLRNVGLVVPQRFQREKEENKRRARHNKISPIVEGSASGTQEPCKGEGDAESY